MTRRRIRAIDACTEETTKTEDRLKRSSLEEEMNEKK